MIEGKGDHFVKNLLNNLVWFRLNSSENVRGTLPSSAFSFFSLFFLEDGLILKIVAFFFKAVPVHPPNSAVFYKAQFIN